MESHNALAALLDAINFADLIAIMIGVGTAGISFILAVIGVKQFWRLAKGV
ncbi:hypothetical protein U4U47_00055 [Klebsiella pneumoniae]|uniref:hypothetical protein n=1 Tax=Klebsiella pneumoniae TaxID=573 RepID=UPI00200E6AFE|nr:hypothetical protein [Klebsiella pneumoniae]EKX7718854.1 hypothetical protein [Escherichia coli]MCL0227812.1 hypothetical protein [Klebsiella pneumoniae]MCL1456578.1 hypothetical protein [Klebsiella pneumoniae]MDK1785055.1 hypothetical protein [Klebsiella pneumoniae]HBV6324286.1 hypothetical protein [Klebsiella pneumoniae]